MERLRTIPKNQVIMAFVATSIETTARFLGVSYKEVYSRMNRVGMIDNYILPNYEPLHSESREVLAQRMVECLNHWEAQL
jgi:DNA-directed RNA polymerase specialized sigma24 family protein